MDEAKKKKLEEMLQNLLERELSQGKDKGSKPSHPGRDVNSKGRKSGNGVKVIRRRKGHPDKKVP
jgi:hypothetical protein